MRRNYIFLISLFTILCLFACSNIKVKHSYISPETKNIKEWSLISADTGNSESEDYPAFEIAEEMFESKYKNADEIKLCLDEITGYLHDYGLKIKDESYESDGVIKLYISGSKKFFTETGRRTSPIDLVRNRTDHIPEGPDDLAEATDNTKANVRPDKSDKIVSVLIEFYNSDSNLIGRATLEGEEIDTQYIARVIRRLIVRNQW
jgi:hypothetical protein